MRVSIAVSAPGILLIFLPADEALSRSEVWVVNETLEGNFLVDPGLLSLSLQSFLLLSDPLDLCPGQVLITHPVPSVVAQLIPVTTSAPVCGFLSVIFPEFQNICSFLW